MMKYKGLLFWGITWILLFIYLEIFYKYHFFYMEQSYLFLFDSNYIQTNLFSIGGGSFLLAAFLNQFFIYPFAGAAITTTLLITVGLLTERIINRIACKRSLPVLYLLPVVFLMFIHFHFNYYIQGTISFIICLLALWIYMRFKSLTVRLVYVVICIPLLYWLAGPVSILLAGAVLIKEVATTPRQSFWFLIPCIEALVISICSVRMGWVGEYRFALLPDMYYFNLIEPDGLVIYLSWISLLVSIAIAGLIRNSKPWSGKKLTVAVALQLIVIVAIIAYRHHKYIQEDTLKFKQIEYYNRTGQWDNVLEINKGELRNYLYACYMNMALAKKGELGERMFEFDQPGPEGLIPQRQKNHHISKAVSDIYFTYGSIAAAQEKAFEANVSSPTGNCSYMLQRLVDTNIIMGEYAVAEKYIDILSKTMYYKDWAEHRRSLLYNDEAVNADELLGSKRKCVGDRNFLYQTVGLLGMLESNAENNPQDNTAVEYMGAAILLHNALPEFEEMLNKYYGTPVLPELPKHFQEAAIVVYDRNRDIWPEKGITPETIERFNKYEQFIRSNQGKPNLAEGAKRYFGNTYWYFYMFK